MSGGGGPACLRLRVPVETEGIGRIPSPPRWSAAVDAQLREIIEQGYPERLTIDDLARSDFHADAQQTFEKIRRLLTQPGSSA